MTYENKLSVCMIIKDEEKHLEKCLDQIKDYVDEIVIVDTGSIDQSKKMAEKYTDKIYDFAWGNNFSEARNFSISKASNDWIFILDADEIVKEFNKDKVINFITDNDKIVGRAKIINFFQNEKEIKESVSYVSRIFNRKYFKYEGLIHEQIVSKDNGEYDVKSIDITIEHFGYLDEVILEKNKLDRNINLLKSVIKDNPKDSYYHYQLGKSYYKAKQYEDAIESFKNSIKTCENFKYEYTEDLIESYGYALLKAKKYIEAMELSNYKQYYETSPDYNFIMGLIYMNNGKFKEAIDNFEKCIGIKEGKVEGINSYQPNYNIGVIYEVLGNLDKARVYYEKCEEYPLAVERLKNITSEIDEKVNIKSACIEKQKEKRLVLAPEYMKKFSCIGSACEDSCCIGWTVSLDKKTYNNYKKSNNENLKPIFRSKINRMRSSNNDVAYGKIKMNNDGTCPFLDDNKLCKIHTNLGEENLSETCAFYPRVVNRIDGMLERSATTSCPEVARLALFNPNGIAFEHIEEDKDLRIKVYSNFDTKGHLFYNKPERYFWDIRLFSMSLLQNRNYSLSERLILLGIVYNKIESLNDTNSIHDVSKILQSFGNMIESGDFREELDKIPTKIQVQMQLIKGLTNKKVVQGITSKRYKECLEETLLGIEDRENNDLEVVLQNYKLNFEKYLKPYLQKKEYILENFLVNEYFKEMMPFGEFKSIWDSYIFLCILYGMVKLHLIGMAGHHKGLNDELTLKLIQSLSKVVLHNRQYIKSIIKLMKDNDFDSLAYMSILVKN